MSVPAASERLDRTVLLQFEAGRLFAERAAAAAPAFAITDANAATIAEVCHRLDGIPLAIELAAVRLNVLSVDQINARLKDRFRLLTGGSRTAVARQRTLEATIDWSYDQLSDAERTLLCRLSIFPGGWTLEAAEDVCAGNGIDKEGVLDLLSRLVDKSLVNTEDDALGRRYRCLETVRQYGRDRLVRSADAERIRDRHLDFFFAFARRAEPELIKADQVLWLNRLQLEYSNLRSALEWCLEAPGRGELALELAAALMWFWMKRGYLGEGREWLERALAAGSGASAALRAKALSGLGLITNFQCDIAASHASLEMSVALAQEAGDQAVAAWSLGVDALLLVTTDGDAARAASFAADSRAMAIASGELWRQGPALSCLAHLAMREGDFDGACRLTEEALMLFRRTGDKWPIEQHLTDLAFFRVLAGQYARAEAVCLEGIALGQELADQLMTAYFIAILAAARAAQGHAIRSVRLWGAMRRMFENVGSRLDPMFESSIGDRFLLPLRQSLGEGAFDALLAEGRAMSLQQAVQYALAETSHDHIPDAGVRSGLAE